MHGNRVGQSFNIHDSLDIFPMIMVSSVIFNTVIMGIMVAHIRLLLSPIQVST